MKSIILLLAVLGLIALTGCVSTTNAPIAHDRLSGLSGATIAVTSRPLPSFAAMRAGNAMFGLVGGLAAIGSGNELIHKYDIKDPAPKIADALVVHLASTVKVQPQPGVVIPIDTTDVSQIAAAAAGKADLVLDVQTVNWSLLYRPINWGHYVVVYTVKFRLVDVRRKELISEGFYAWQTPKETGYSTFDELFADNAAVLRQRLKEASNVAIAVFETGVLRKQ